MAANKSQGSYLGVFLLALTVLSAGIAYFETGFGKLTLAIGAAGLVASMLGFLNIKPLEGRTAQRPSPLGPKLVGACVSALGWGLTLIGLHFTPGTDGRIVVALLGIAVSLFGMLYVLPAAFNKNAVWRAQSGSPERVDFRAVAKTTTTTVEGTR